MCPDLPEPTSTKPRVATSRAADSRAILHSLQRTAALTGIDSYAHPIKLFERPAADWPQRRIDELLPEHHVAAVQPAETVVAEPQPVG